MYINGTQVATSTVELNTTASAFYIGKSPFVAYGTN
jgi:TRAP-type mannitol/chloroaromatic compound transport system substrate-binding protein